MVLWLFMSVVLLTFWFWTIYVVLKQKAAWRLYAEKRKMRFHSNGFLETPSVSGALDGYRVTIFPSEHSELDARSQRRLTAIEITLHSGLPVRSAMATGGMVQVVEALDIYREYKPSVKGWDDSYVIRTADVGVMEGYLTEDRLNKLLSLMKVDRAWIVFLCLEDVSLLRLDTPLPIDDPKKLDLLIKQMINAAKALEMQDGEGKDLMRKRSKPDEERSKLKVDETLLGDDIGFELEDDS